MKPILRSTRPWLWLGIVLIGVVGVVAASYFTSASMTRRIHKRSDPDSPSYRPPSDAQIASLKLEYPKPSGRTVPAISVTYNAGKDRTKTTIELKEPKPAPGASSAPGVYGVVLKLTSEFVGKVRPADHGEASLDGEVVVKSKAAGALTAADAPGEIDIDGSIVHLHHPAKGKTPFASSPQPDHINETIRFRVHTATILKAAAAQSVILRFGKVQVQLTADQTADLREFAARLNPVP
jgi:hypothetical protein